MRRRRSRARSPGRRRRRPSPGSANPSRSRSRRRGVAAARRAAAASTPPRAADAGASTSIERSIGDRALLLARARRQARASPRGVAEAPPRARRRASRRPLGRARPRRTAVRHHVLVHQARLRSGPDPSRTGGWFVAERPRHALARPVDAGGDRRLARAQRVGGLPVAEAEDVDRGEREPEVLGQRGDGGEDLAHLGRPVGLDRGPRLDRRHVFERRARSGAGGTGGAAASRRCCAGRSSDRRDRRRPATVRGAGEDPGEGVLDEVLGVLARSAQRPRGAVERVEVLTKRRRVKARHDACQCYGLRYRSWPLAGRSRPSAGVWSGEQPSCSRRSRRRARRQEVTMFAHSPSPRPCVGRTARHGRRSRNRDVVRTTSRGKLLTDGAGLVLFVFSRGPSQRRSLRLDAQLRQRLADRQHPRHADGRAAASSARCSGTIQVARQGPQVTYAGHPLYRYSAEPTPGATDYVGAHASGGIWRAIRSPARWSADPPGARCDSARRQPRH